MEIIIFVIATIIEIALIIGFLIWLIAYTIKKICIERKEFNNHKCNECGEELKFVDTDSLSGAVLFKCYKCNHEVWCEYRSTYKKYISFKTKFFNFKGE